jgi:hypothetical protein
MKIIILRLMLSGTVALAAACSTLKSPPAEATVKTKAPQVTQGKTAAAPAATDELDDYAEVAAFAQAWPKGLQAYPHLAAGASLQRYAGTDGIPAAEPVPAGPKKRRPKLRAKPTAKRKAGCRARR